MDKKLYMQPSFRVNISQLEVYMQDLSIAKVEGAEDISVNNEGDNVAGDSKLRGEWSENGLW